MALEKGLIGPGLLKRITWSIKSAASGRNFKKKRIALEKHWREVDGRKEASIAMALNDTLGREFWIGGLFKVPIFIPRIPCPHSEH